MNVLFPRAQMLAALCNAGKQDVRYYLNGVHVVSTQFETRLIATDGATVSVQRSPAVNEFIGEFTIPRATIEQAAKMRPVAGLWAAEVLAGNHRLLVAGTAFPFTPVDGKFPDVTRCIPREPSGAAGDYDPARVQQFAKAGKCLGVKGAPVIRQNGKGAALIQFLSAPDYCGVLMPLRMFNEKNPDPGLPEWAFT